MFKLLGQVLGHSFGLVVIVLITVIGGLITNATTDEYLWLYIIDGMYAFGYTLIPFVTCVNKLLEGRTKRKAIKVNMYSPEFLKEFEYEMNKYANKELNKIVVKEAKKTKEVNNGKELL